MKKYILPKSVKTFVMFVGFGRSGHSFIAQALHSHPDALIGNEGRIYEYYNENPSLDAVYSYCRKLAVSFEKRNFTKHPKMGNSQNLRIKGGWQTIPDNPIIFGNSRAGATTQLILRKSDLIDNLVDNLGLPIKVIAISRHPLDMLGSRIKRSGMEFL